MLDFSGDPDAVLAARRLRGELRRATKTMTLDTIFAVALHMFPDEAPAQAMQKLAQKTAEALLELNACGESARSVHAAALTRLAPLRRAATNRLLEDAGRLDHIPRVVESLEKAAHEKRKELAGLGVTEPAIIERAAPFPDRAKFQAEKCALEAEMASLEAFLRTGDESVLPPGIQPLYPVKNEAPPSAPHKSRMAYLAEEITALMAAPVSA